MLKLNENYLKLPGSYLFAEIARRTAAYSEANPGKRLIKLGIGDVTLPLPAACVDALRSAAGELGVKESFVGYGPYEGYGFLREAIVENDYLPRGAKISPDELFISDGAKSDCGNIGDIFSEDCVVAVCDPVYPVYIDANAMAGRAGDYIGGKWTNIVYMPCTAENGFFPELPARVPDLIYLCFPNNPTGMAAAARSSSSPGWTTPTSTAASYSTTPPTARISPTPSSPGASTRYPARRPAPSSSCSFSKTAGFTGTRCGWTVIPRALVRGGESLYDMWMRRQSTKFNGTAYVIQRAAEAVYTPEGKEQVAGLIGYYMNNARVIREGLASAGLEVYGGTDSPYIWFRAPDGQGSWEFFDRLLSEANVVTTPGAGFGPSGEGFIRLTAFGDAENTREAVERIKAIL